MNIVFMGTPDFAVPALKALCENHTVSAVFTQPDKPKNRGKKIQFTPVKEFAVEKNIPVYQPLSLRKGEDAEQSLKILSEISPDVIVVAAYGQILPEAILNLPQYGCVNIHASLLPQYRGAAPIQKCIVDGMTKSGVTTMMMAKGLDTGDMLLKGEVEIFDTMTAGELHDKLCEIGAELILNTLDGLSKGSITPEKQNDELSCYAPVITKEMCRIDFTKPMTDVYNFIRGMSPSPCAYTFIGGKRLKVYFAEKTDITSSLPCGALADEKNFLVVCGDNKCIALTDIMPEGSKRMKGQDFLRGYKAEKGMTLGE